MFIQFKFYKIQQTVLLSTFADKGTVSTSRGIAILENSSIVYRSPIDLLHVGQIGMRLLISIVPPFECGVLCPTSNVNGVTGVTHQDTLHLQLNFSPYCCNHTLFFNDLDICLRVFLDCNTDSVCTLDSIL